jgi:aspartate aminotransferase-like enzyme
MIRAATPSFGTFFLPGPTEVRPAILAAMTRPMIGHRGSEFETLFARIESGLKAVFLTERPVYVSSSSATGLMEAAVRNAPDGDVLSLVNGAFSDRFATMASACGRRVERIDAAEGAVVALDRVEDALRGGRYAAITVVHSETSTGALTDVRAVSELAHRYGSVCLIDSVSGIAGAELRMDEWQLDFVFTGSQKAFALPPGLSFAAASPEFVERARTIERRGLYFDVVELETFAARNQTPNTPALSLLYALDDQLQAIMQEGITGRWARHAEMRAATEAWMARCSARFGIEIDALARPGERSPTVTAVRLPAEAKPRDIPAAVRKRGYVIGGGYGSLKDSTIRIGHMGDQSVVTLEACLDVVEMVIAEMLGRTQSSS